MQSVSAGWKENQQKTLVNESFIEIQLGLTDPEAVESAVPVATDVAPFAHLDQVVSRGVRNITPYATLERNLWVLDGSKKVLPITNFVDTSYVGNVLSNSDCTFTSNPVVELTFPRVFYSYLPGLIIIWDMAHGGYAVDFKITLYKEGVKGSEKLVTGNDTTRTVVDMDINEYDEIVVEILKWSSPRRRARIARIHLGRSITYGKGELFGTFTHSQEVDPLSAKMPKMSLKFGVSNVDDSYNPYNQAGISKYLVERQEIQVRYGYRIGSDVEWIPGGTFYLSGWEAPQNGLYANFEARDILEFMNGIFMKGVYRPNGISLKALAEEVLLDAGLPEREDELLPWKLHDSLDDIYTVAPLPLVRHSECLQMIANAAGCVMYVDREGFLRIEPAPTSMTDYRVDNFNSYKRPEVALTKPLKQVDVSYYSFVVDAEVKEIYKGQLSVSGTETIQITYSNPAVETVATVEGGTLVNATYYTNACELEITASGIVEITIVGKELKTSEATVTVSTGEPGETQSVKNELITSQSRATAVANWVKEYLTNRRIISLDWRADPRLDALDKIMVQNKFGISPLRATEFTIAYNGAFKGKGRGRDLG
ncbi:MAG: hypothetical protein ACOYCB_11520 [Fastidiosipilaceae bacterium]